ncbi:MAG: YibE/F family protein [Propionibacteriaceae bacterium]|jgi:uncharacterized membrane protein|nr:YibE/F family protein [Propionibacteriaceae bacterium]
MHSHLHSDVPTETSRTVKITLIAIMCVLFAVTVAGVALLWPQPGELPDKRPWLSEGAKLVSGTVTGIEIGREEGELDVRPDGSAADVIVQTNPGAPAKDMRVGDRIQLIELPPVEVTEGSNYIFFDYHRELPMALLAAFFVIVVIAVARVKGLLAILGLVAALVMIWVFTLPALAAGKDALLTALLTASAVMFIVVYLAHGISVKTTTALLGTYAGIAVVTITAWLAIPAAKLTPLMHEELTDLEFAAPATDLRGVLLCGMVLAGVGVLNDVTITQASAVWELRAAAPNDSRFSLFTRAMRIGRDHIASTVYTIAFAYIGSSLGLLTVASTLDFGITELLTFEDIAEELIPTLVASIGLVLAIPFTTAIGTWLAGGESEPLALDNPSH